MKLWRMTAVVLVGLMIAACGGEGQDDDGEARTISPATPEVTDDSEPDLSQTLEIGEDRSQNEGASLPGFEEEVRDGSEGPPDYVEVADDGQPVPPEKDAANEPD